MICKQVGLKIKTTWFVNPISFTPKMTYQKRTSKLVKQPLRWHWVHAHKPLYTNEMFMKKKKCNQTLYTVEILMPGLD